MNIEFTKKMVSYILILLLDLDRLFQKTIDKNDILEKEQLIKMFDKIKKELNEWMRYNMLVLNIK